MSVLERRVGAGARRWVRRVEVLGIREVRWRGLLIALRSGLSRTSSAKDGWIVGHGRRSSLGLLDFVLYAEILHIAAAEDDVLVDVVGSSDLVLAIAAAFGTERGDILEGNGGALGVDLMEGSNVSDVTFRYQRYPGTDVLGHRGAELGARWPWARESGVCLVNGRGGGRKSRWGWKS